MKEKKSVKALKGQLFGAVAMMVVAAIALGTSTYAWFISNTTAEVANMNLTVSTSTSLQIAVRRKASATDAATKPVTPYKNIIATLDINGKATTEGGWENMFAKDAAYQMKPASISNDGLKAATPAFFVSNGHMNTTGDKLDQFYTFTSADSALVGEGAIKKLPLSFISTSATNVYLGKETLTSIADLVVKNATADNDGKQAAAIRAALRIAVVPLKTTTKTTDAAVTDTSYSGSTDAPVIFQFDDGAKLRPAIAGNNTDYSGATIGSITQDEAAGKYIAIETAAATSSATAGTAVATVAQQTAMVPGKDIKTAGNLYLVTVARDKTTGVAAVTNYTDNKPLFALVAEQPRDVDVYIWLEGADQDCLSNLSAMTFDVVLPFAAAPTSATVRP